MSIVFYISGHGFGHASRDIEVLNALLDRRADLARRRGCRPSTRSGRGKPAEPRVGNPAGILVRTPAPRWLFDLTLRHPVRFEPAETDTGIVQTDSLHLDAAESIGRAAAFYRDFDEKAAAEAAHLREAGARLVIADIPALAFRAAAIAGLPAIALGNFTWDWIYEGYRELLADAPGLVRTLSEAYATASLALRLPMHGGFASMRTIRDIPFVARRSRRDPRDVRAALGLPGDRRLVLLSFGGHGLRGLDLDRIDHLGEYVLLTTAEHAGRNGANAIRIDEHGLYESGLRYEDLVAASDVVVTKPGYGIISECIANDTAMLYTSRGHFVEYEVLVECLPQVLRSRFISQEDLYAGSWRAHLDALLAQPPPPERPATNGADVAAEAILAAFDGL